MATRLGIQRGDCELLEPSARTPTTTGGQGSARAAAWAQVMDEALEFVRAGLAMLAEADVEPPIAGYEYADVRGEIVAEAELAWPGQKLVVVLEAQAEFEATWAALGWTSVTAAGAWANAVLDRLKPSTMVEAVGQQEDNEQS